MFANVTPRRSSSFSRSLAPLLAAAQPFINTGPAKPTDAAGDESPHVNRKASE